MATYLSVILKWSNAQTGFEKKPVYMHFKTNKRWNYKKFPPKVSCAFIRELPTLFIAETILIQSIICCHNLRKPRTNLQCMSWSGNLQISKLVTWFLTLVVVLYSVMIYLQELPYDPSHQETSPYWDISKYVLCRLICSLTGLLSERTTFPPCKATQRPDDRVAFTKRTCEWVGQSTSKEQRGKDTQILRVTNERGVTNEIGVTG